MRTTVVLLALGLVACGSSQRSSGVADALAAATGMSSTTPPATTTTDAGAPPAARAPLDLPAEPACPSGSQATYACDGEAAPPPAVAYAPPFERCRTSPMFSRRESAARSTAAGRACCQLRCASPPGAADLSGY